MSAQPIEPASEADLWALLADTPAEELEQAIESLPIEFVHALLGTQRGTVEATPANPLIQAQEIDPGFRSRPHLEYLSQRIAQAVEDVENGQSRKIVISMPPRMGKSTLGSIHTPTWILRRHPEWKIGLVSHSPSLAVSWGRSIRRQIEEYGAMLNLTIARDAGAAADWQTLQRGGVTSRSAPNQSITGLGFKVMILDDLVKDFAAAHSVTQRQSIWDWWLANSLTRLEPPSLVIAIGTRWHEDDFIGRLLSTEYDGDPDEWEVINFPAIAEDADVLGRAPGEPLISPLLEETDEEAHKRWDSIKRGVGSYVWAALYQGRPAPAEGAIFNTGWWRYWTKNPANATEDERVVYLDPDEHGHATWLDSWDMAFKGTDSSDYVVGQRWLKVGADRFLIDQMRKRMTFTQTLAAVLAFADNGRLYSRHVHKRLVEEKANGAAVIDVLRKKIPGMLPRNPKDPKEVRAHAVTPECESGNVLLPYPGDPGNEWVADLLSELRNFPNDAHDDQVDALTQALKELRDAGVGGLTVPGQSKAGRAAQLRPVRITQTAAAMGRRTG